MKEIIRCTRCSEVIGTYEPTVVVDRDGVHRTSIAAHGRDSVHHGEARYHRACYETWFGENPEAIAS